MFLYVVFCVFRNNFENGTDFKDICKVIFLLDFKESLKLLQVFKSYFIS